MSRRVLHRFPLRQCLAVYHAAVLAGLRLAAYHTAVLITAWFRLKLNNRSHGAPLAWCKCKNAAQDGFSDKQHDIHIRVQDTLRVIAIRSWWLLVAMHQQLRHGPRLKMSH